MLLQKLQGISPISAGKKDKRGWGPSSGRYSACVGYSAILAIPWVAADPLLWKTLWKFPSLPKVDFFCWSLLHNSILTFDNLKKRGWAGPSRCPLCSCSEESVDHLFVLCPFALEMWKLVLGPLNIVLPPSFTNLFYSWINLAPFPLASLSLLKNCWIWIPKLICWNLWLERNGIISRDTASPPAWLAAKVKVLVNELVASKPLLHNDTLPDRGTYSWFYDLDPYLTTRTKTLQSQHSSWKSELESKISLSGDPR